MVPGAGAFLVALAATVVAVGVTALLGRTGRRRAHVASAAVTTVVLGATIYLAEVLGKHILIPLPVKITHLTFANLAFLAFLGVVATGIGFFRDSSTTRRMRHRRIVYAFLVLTLVATATGTWMLAVSTPR